MPTSAAAPHSTKTRPRCLNANPPELALLFTKQAYKSELGMPIGDGDKRPMHRRTGSARLRSPEADLRPLFVSRRDGLSSSSASNGGIRCESWFLRSRHSAQLGLLVRSPGLRRQPFPRRDPITRRSKKRPAAAPVRGAGGGGPGFAAPQDAGALHAAVAIGIGPGATSHFA